MLNVILDGLLQFGLLLAMISGMFVIPASSLVTVFACSTGRLGAAALAFTGGWMNATLIIWLGLCLKALRAAP